MDCLVVDWVKGIGFVMLGVFNYREGVVLYKGNDKYEVFYGINVKDSFLVYLNWFEMLICFLNDVSVFVVGENWFGEVKGVWWFIVIILGIGFGLVLLEDGIFIVNWVDVFE